MYSTISSLSCLEAFLYRLLIGEKIVLLSYHDWVDQVWG